MIFICAWPSALAQNVVSSVAARDVLPPEPLPADFAQNLISAITASSNPLPVPSDDEARRVAAKLEAHVRTLIDGWPWRPLHHVLGISGFETYFDHPDELFYALSLAMPLLSTESQKRVRVFLTARLVETAPFEVEGFERERGAPRESYDVPESLRAHGRGAAHSLFGISAFALFVSQLDESSRAQLDLSRHWQRIRQRMAPILAKVAAPSAPANPAASGDAEQLNGNLAGLLGAAQLAIALRDDQGLHDITAAIQQLAQWRNDLERTNPQFVEKTAGASKNLHNFKLSRYCALTPAVARCLEGATRSLAAKRLRAFREVRPGWQVALGDRLIGGENYTNPLHFDRALFAGAALIEELPRAELLRLIDVPACKADFYFIEKCALALRARTR
jgi:hypothetical protein